MSDSEVVKLQIQPTIPAELHGFSVTVGLGPYPPDEPMSHRRAVYAELLPISQKARRALRRMNRERILSMTPLTAEAAEQIALDPGGSMAERASRDTLAEAAKLAAQV